VCALWTNVASVLLCLIDPRVRKIRNEISSYPGIFPGTVRSVASSPLSQLLDGHRKLEGCAVSQKEGFVQIEESGSYHCDCLFQQK